ncbi:MAG TPA: hypothetical protein PKY29_02240 [Ferruginibacter sp.]|nr:hypothetical protein [Ferruginibacter sp.]HRN78797.1 hypothetical protein [Ferruginibacter sp.]HRO17708.1 hypothetical protein [Ferruginibacter sp.]HRQ20101.1 hypothetical protein [Ferruginibacter sp.]
MKTFIFLLLLNNAVHAQFYVSSKSTFQPEYVLAANYNPIDLKPYIGVSLPFDAGNPYTTMVSIKDERNNTYQMIIQTGFLGNLQYAGMSTNLWMPFNNPKKPPYGFRNCMNRLNDLFSFASPADHVTGCVIQRLNEVVH